MLVVALRLPTVPPAPNCKVEPAAIVVGPVYVLLPSSASDPLLTFSETVCVPEAIASLITPLKTLVPPAKLMVEPDDTLLLPTVLAAPVPVVESDDTVMVLPFRSKV